MTINRRRASTLVELMMCLSAGSSLMLVAIGLVHQTLMISSRVSQQADHDRSLARLSALFRHDAHRATQASADSEVQMRMNCDDGSAVIYRFAGYRIMRQHERASGEVENESFTFDDKCSATFQSLDKPDRVELLIRRETGLHNVAPRTELHVAAAVNRLPWAEQGGEASGEEARP